MDEVGFAITVMDASTPLKAGAAQFGRYCCKLSRWTNFDNFDHHFTQT